jgi:hypothetical protein
MIKEREDSVPSSMNTKSDILDHCNKMDNMGQDDLQDGLVFGQSLMEEDLLKSSSHFVHRKNDKMDEY